MIYIEKKSSIRKSLKEELIRFYFKNCLEKEDQLISVYFRFYHAFFDLLILFYLNLIKTLNWHVIFAPRIIFDAFKKFRPIFKIFFL